MKTKSDIGLETELREVKTAGFKLNKREKNTNRKAGLHDKNKSPEGEARVKRRKPLALKHVRRMRKAAAALSCVFVVAVFLFGAGAFLREDVEKYTGFQTVCYEIPSDGSGPLDHTLVENVGYLNYVLKGQKHWSSEMSSKVNAMGFDQSVATYKQYYNGVLISADVANGFSSKATQFCVNEDKGIVLWRPAATKNFNGMNTEWSTEKAEWCTVEDFIKYRGFPPSEFSVYILNEKTIANAEDYSVKANGDGTFEMTVDLNVGIGGQEPERAADYYYTKQMMVTGDLPTEPSITKTSVTYTFDKDWRVLSFIINDEYTAMGVVPCTSQTVVKFDYSEESAVNSFYNDYFKEQEETLAPPTAPGQSTSPMGYLGTAFGSVLTEGGTFKIDLKIDNLDLNGVVYAGISNGSLNDLRISLGDIFAALDENGDLYISDGNAKYKLNITAFSGSTDDSSSSGGIDFDAITEQLIGGKFTVGENCASLESELEIFGLKVSLKFDFINADNTIKLDCCSAKIPLGGKIIEAEMRFGSKEDIPALPSDLGDYIDVMQNGIALDISAEVDKLKLNGFVNIIPSKDGLKGVYATLGDFGIYFDSPQNALYINAGTYKFRLPLNALNGVDFNGLLSSLDTSSLLAQILNNLSAADGQISTEAMIEIFGNTLTAAVGVKLVGGIGINADLNIFGKDILLSAELSDKTYPVPDLSEYEDILNGEITLGLSVGVEDLVMQGKATIKLEGGAFKGVYATLGDFKISYEAGNLYVSDGKNANYKIALGESLSMPELGGIDIKSLISGLVFGDGQISLEIPVGEDKLNVTVKLNDGLKIEVSGTIYGLNINASVNPEVGAVARPNLEEYTDILNGEITLGLSVGVEDLVMQGKATIKLEGGAFKGVYATLGDFKISYEAGNLYVSDGKNANYKIALGESLSMPELGGIDIKSLISGLVFGDGQISLEIPVGEDKLNVTVKLNDGLKIEVSGTIYGLNINASVNPEVGAVARPNLEEYTDILNGEITLGLSVGVEDLVMQGKATIKLEGGAFKGVYATLGDFKISYEAGNLYVSDGKNANYKIALGESLSMPELGGIDIKSLISGLVFGDGQISLEIPVGEDKLNVTVKLNDGLKIEVSGTIYGLNINASVNPEVGAVARPNLEEYTDILNGEITLGLSVGVEDLVMQGKATIKLEGGAFKGVYATLGDFKISYEAGNLYVSDGKNANYKIALGESLSMPELGGIDIKSLISGLVFGDGQISLEIPVGEDKLNVTVKLNDGLKIEVSGTIYGLNINASVNPEVGAVARPNLEEYTDILNGEITLGLSVGVEDLVMQGKATIKLEGGAFKGVYATLGDFKISYEAGNLYVSDGKNANYKIALGESLSMPELGGIDIKSLISGLVFGDGQISLEIPVGEDKLNVTVKLNDGLKIEVSGTIYGLNINASVNPEVGAVARPNLEEYTDILNGEITLGLSVGVEDLVMQGKATIKLEGGAFKGVYATLGDFKISYEAGNLYVSDGKNANYKIALGESLSMPELGGIDIKSLISGLVFGDGQISLEIPVGEDKLNVTVKLNDGLKIEVSGTIYGLNINASVNPEVGAVARPNLEEYTDILNGEITLGLSVGVEDLVMQGLATIKLEGGAFKGVYAELGGLKVYYEFAENAVYIDDGNVKYKVSIPATAKKGAASSDISVLIEDLLSVVNFDSDRITANITFGDINAVLEVKLFGGISIDLSANVYGKNITVGLTPVSGDVSPVQAPSDYSSFTDILNEGLTIGLSLDLDKVTLDGRVFIGLTEGRFTELRADFGSVQVYCELASKKLYIKIGETKAYIDFNEMPQGLIDMLGLFGNSDGFDFESQSIIAELLGNLTAGLREIIVNGETVTDGIYISSVAKLTLKDFIVAAGLKINLPDSGDGLSIEADAMLFGINAKVFAKPDAEELPALSLEDKEGYVNAIKDTWKLLDQVVGQNITAVVEGQLYDKSADTMNHMKYDFDALLEYDRGNGEGDSEISALNGMYLHLGINLTAAAPDVESFYFDLVLTDANPVSVDGTGKTNGGYTTDGRFDVYLSVSKYRNNSNPLKLYASADEILTLVSMVGAAANLDEISFENSEYVSEAVGKIADMLIGQASGIIDGLIETYIPYTKDQFSSLGKSLIPQILGTDLQGLLDKLLGSVGNTVKEEPSEGSEDKNKDYIESITGDDKTLVIVLNSPVIYGDDTITYDKYLKVEFYKDIDADGVARLGGVKIENIYYGDDNVNKMNIGLDLSYGEVARPDASSGLRGYLNLEGIDTLLKAMVNSATHETGIADNKYELNDEYLLSGSINAKLSILSSANINIRIDTLKICIDENNKVSADVHLSYDALRVTVVFVPVTAINGGCDVYMSIRNDMIYISRIQNTDEKGNPITPVTETRIMPLDAFLDDIMNQINFIFNFGSLIADQLAGIDTGSGSGVSFDNKDYGESLDYVLSKYLFNETETGASWTVAISNKMLTSAVGMTMSDIPVTISADKNADGTLTVKGLDIEPSKMTLLGSISLDFSGKLEYKNPHGVTDGFTDSSIALNTQSVPNFDGKTWNDVLGGDNFADITEHTNWNLLLGDTNSKFLSYAGGKVLEVRTLRFEYATDATNTEFVSFGEEQLVLYNQNTNRIYTRAVVPSLDVMPQINGKTAVWQSDCYTDDEGKLVYRAVYDTTYTVSIESAFKTDGNYSVTDDGVWLRDIQKAYKNVYLRKDLIHFDDGIPYGLKGYSSEKGGEIIDFAETEINGDGELCYKVPVDGNVKYYAVWERAYALNFADEYGRQETIYYYAGETIGDRAPALPQKEGYTAYWNTDLSSAVVPEMDNSVIEVSFRINSYTVTIVTGAQFDGEIEGFEKNADGNYYLTAEYNTVVRLPALYSVSPAYKFGGYYLEPDYSGKPLEVSLASDYEITLDKDIIYYVRWQGKKVNVTYRSDLDFSAGLTHKVYDEDGNAVEFYYQQSLVYGANNNLSQFAMEDKTLFGWFMPEGDGYVIAETAEALLNKLEYSLEGVDEIDVTLWAVWIDSAVKGEITEVTAKKGFINTTWDIKGYVSSPISGKSAEIASAAGINIDIQVKYGVSKSGTSMDADLNWNKWEGVYADGSFEKNVSSTNGTNKYSYGGCDVKLTLTLGGVNKTLEGGLWKSVV